MRDRGDTERESIGRGDERCTLACSLYKLILAIRPIRIHGVYNPHNILPRTKIHSF